MKVLIAIIFNMGLLALLLPWLRRQWQWAATGPWRTVLVLGLGLRVLVGMVQNWNLRLDAQFMCDLSYPITSQMLTAPVQAFKTLTQAVTVIPYPKYDAVYQSTSNTWFFVKVLAFLNLASLEIGWVNGLYLSIFSFLGCWLLFRALQRVLPTMPAGSGAVALLLWPSVWFWAAGVSKEALLVGSGTWLTALILGRLYDRNSSLTNWKIAYWWLSVGTMALLHFRMRYFFAAPLLAVLVGVGLVRGLQLFGLARPRWVQAVVLFAVLGGGGWVGTQVSVAFRVNKFTNQVMRLYSSDLPHLIGRPHFEYPDMGPTLESILAHVPLAVTNTLSRPMLGESIDLRYVAVGLENLLLLLLLAIEIVAVMRGRGGHMPFVLGLGLVVFCVILASLIGLTTPNLGSLHRYRSGLLPYLVLLLLQNDYAAIVLHRLGLKHYTLHEKSMFSA